MQKHYISTHYYFDDKTHSMDAFVLNKCDKEILESILIFAEALKLKDDLKLEKLANEEGGLIDWYQALVYTDKIATAGFLVACIAAYFTVFPRKSKPSKEIETLTIKNLELDNKKKTLEISNLEEINLGLKELNEEYKHQEPPDLSKDKRFEELKTLFLKTLHKNIKLRRSQSNFYQKLLDYNKVQSVGFASYDAKQTVITDEKIIERKDFNNFILETSEDVEVKENVKIMIASPNLLPRKNKWRGYLIDDELNIQFSMLDKDFQNDINNGVINFANGSTIVAVLIVTTKFDEFGDETSKNYQVETVLNYSIDKTLVDTLQGKKYKFNKKQIENQQDFDF